MFYLDETFQLQNYITVNAVKKYNNALRHSGRLLKK